MNKATLVLASSLMILGAEGIVAGEGPVSLQSAEPSCANGSSNIYVDCGNGTVTDNRTGLVWLANANCVGTVDWYTAMEFVAGLSDLAADSAAAGGDCGLSDNSSPGEWRLPAADEWEAMVAGAKDLNCQPAITNDQGNGCWGALGCVILGSCSFADVQSEYWSSTSASSSPFLQAYSAILDSGGIGISTKVDNASYFVWPVRGGQ